MSVVVTIEIGHRATVRNSETNDGFTHDWEIFVQGHGGARLECFVEKVVFTLHKSFPKPERVIKAPPYRFAEKGYGSFTLPIEICFKTNEEPRKHRLEYDLYLQPLNGSPFNYVRKERLTFREPGDDFRRKLLQGGGEYSSTGNDRSGGASPSSGAKNNPHAAQESSNSHHPKKHKTDIEKDQPDPKECPICNNFYNANNDHLRVRTLRCGHSMCTSCLQQLHQGNSVTCPQCRYVDKSDSVDGIPINFGMEALIHDSIQPTPSSPAGSCPILNGGMCQNHATMKLFYCDTCKEFVCAHCTVLDHSRSDGHNIINIQKALSNKKSSSVNGIDCEIKKLQSVQNTLSDRLKVLGKAKSTHTGLLQQFANVMSQIQNTVDNIDALSAVQTLNKQDIQQQINQLSFVKQQVINTETLTELSTEEQKCSSSVKQARKCFTENVESKDFDQLQKKSDAVIIYLNVLMH